MELIIIIIEDAEALATIDDKIASQIIASQRKELVSEIEAINKVKHMKGQVAAIFDIKNKILGNKKKPEREATAVINFRTRELEVCPEKIKGISLDYNLISLIMMSQKMMYEYHPCCKTVGQKRS